VFPIGFATVLGCGEQKSGSYETSGIYIPVASRFEIFTALSRLL
jgi:hypothetical protein